MKLKETQLVSRLTYVSVSLMLAPSYAWAHGGAEFFALVWGIALAATCLSALALLALVLAVARLLGGAYRAAAHNSKLRCWGAATLGGVAGFVIGATGVVPRFRVSVFPPNSVLQLFNIGWFLGLVLGMAIALALELRKLARVRART